MSTTSRWRRSLAVLFAILATVTMLVGCTRDVSGQAVKAGSGGNTPPRNDNSAKTTPPNLLKECDVLTTDVLAKTVGADPLDIQSTFVGALCRWQALNPRADRHHPVLVRTGQPGQRTQGRRLPEVSGREPCGGGRAVDRHEAQRRQRCVRRGE